MAEISSQVNIKEKINAVRSVVPNKSNNEIILVLQQFDNNVNKAVQAFMDGSALQVLKEWNMTGKKKNSKRKRSKSKQHHLSKDMKDKDEGAEKVSLESRELNSCHLNGCDKDTFLKPASEKSTVITQEEKSLEYKERGETKTESSDPKAEQKKVSIVADRKYINSIEVPDASQHSHQSSCNISRPKFRTSTAKSPVPVSHLEIKPEDSIKKRGPNIEKSVKDLQRCTVSLTRYRMMIKEEVDSSVKKIKAAFAELHSCIIDREVSLMAEVDKVKEDAMEILTARQKKAEELKRLTDLASQMAETQLAELRAEIKHFVSERKYDEELGRSARFSCDIEQLKTQILQCGEISHPKNNYSSRTPSSTQSATLHAATSIQSTYIRKSSSRACAKTPDGKAVIAKGLSQAVTNATESSPQIISTNKQAKHSLKMPDATDAGETSGRKFSRTWPHSPKNSQKTMDAGHESLRLHKIKNGSSNHRRRFYTQYHGIRMNGSVKPQSAGTESDQNNTKGSSWHEYRRPHYSSYRPKNKGTLKTQEQSASAKSTENLLYPEKTRRKHPTPGPMESRSLCNSITTVSQCNLCPSRIETSADAPVLSVPAVTLVA